MKKRRYNFFRTGWFIVTVLIFFLLTLAAFYNKLVTTVYKIEDDKVNGGMLYMI